jgi:hypothetical protein
VSRIGRRGFLALGAGALAWAACARDNGDPEAGPVDPEEAVSLAITSPQLVVGDGRIAFALFQGDRVPLAPEELSARVLGPGGEDLDVEPTRVPITFGFGGDMEPFQLSTIYVVRHSFDSAGVWTMNAAFEGAEADGSFQVLEGSSEPGPGDEALASVSPTFDDPRDVDPICTRNPVCSMHELTVADALASGRPTVVTFGTPAFCTSRICGPIVDLVEQAKDEVGEDVNFIHVEVWRNNTDAVNDFPDGLVPAFGDWQFPPVQHETWSYFIDADGIVVERYAGPAGPDEFTSSARALLG